MTSGRRTSTSSCSSGAGQRRLRSSRRAIARAVWEEAGRVRGGAPAPARTRSSERALDPPQRGTVRLDDCSGGGRYRIRGAAFLAVLARGSSLCAGRVCVRSRAGTGSPKPPSVDLRGSLGSRARGRGPATGRGTERSSWRGRLMSWAGAREFGEPGCRGSTSSQSG